MSSEANGPTRSELRHGHRRRVWPLAVAVVVGLLGAGVIGALVGSASDTDNSAKVVAARASCPVTRVAAEGLPSVVMISVQSGRGGSTGSGEVIRSDGEILTNNHVISDAANGGGSISVLFGDGVTAPAQLVGRDPETDLAVIKVQTTERLSVITFGSSANLQVGEPVVALGAPLGFPDTVTAGIVSALDRSVDVPSDNGSTALLVSAIQTDASINPGNSGGALVDCNARLVGVPTAGATAPGPLGTSSSGSIGINFAIPGDFAKSISNEIIATGTVTHSFFGIQVVPVTPSSTGPSAGAKEGLFVTGVTPSGPSDDAGIRAGDVITKINGEPARSANQLQALTLTKKPGDTVVLTYERNGTSHATTVTLAAEPSQS
jgi:putative serine protease PepD